MKKAVFVTMLSFLFVLTAGMSAYAAGKSTLSHADKEFMEKAAAGGMMEVQLGQLAQQKGESADVKDFGSRMVADHGKADDELKALAGQKDVKLPEKLKGKEKSAVDKLSKLSGPKFDKEYMHEMVKDHVKDVAAFEKAKKKVKDPDLRGWVDKTLPVLEGHLKLAKETAGKVGVDVNKAVKEGKK